MSDTTFNATIKANRARGQGRRLSMLQRDILSAVKFCLVDVGSGAIRSWARLCASARAAPADVSAWPFQSHLGSVARRAIAGGVLRRPNHVCY